MQDYVTLAVPCPDELRSHVRGWGLSLSFSDCFRDLKDNYDNVYPPNNRHIRQIIANYSPFLN